MLRSVSLRVKVVGMSLLMAAFLVIVGAVGLNGLHKTSQNYEHIAQVNLDKTRFLGNMQGICKDITRAMVRLSISGNPQAEIENIISRIKKRRPIYEELRGKFLALPLDEGEKELVQNLDEAAKTFFESGEIAMALSLKGDPESRAKSIKYLNEEYRNIYDKVMFPALDKLIEYQDSRSDYWTNLAQATARSANITAIIAIGLGMSISLLAGFIFATSLSKSLRGLSSDLVSRSAEVASASHQVLSSSSALSSSTTQQSAATQESAAAIDEMSSMLKKTTKNAQDSEKLSIETSEKAVRGKEVLGEMTGAIADISKSNSAISAQMEQTNRQLSEIAQLISEIASKTKVINDIVFQTKLLSFNASVEAARAGEHGKGFSVVAEEIGNLATMSGRAAHEISEMLAGSIRRVEGIVDDTRTRIEALIQTGREKVVMGEQTAGRCNDVLSSILENVDLIKQRAGEISSASQEQMQGIQNITQAIHQLSESVHQNSSTATETSSAADSLTRQAQALNTMVDTLKAVVEGCGNQAQKAVALEEQRNAESGAKDLGLSA